MWSIVYNYNSITISIVIELTNLNYRRSPSCYDHNTACAFRVERHFWKNIDLIMYTEILVLNQGIFILKCIKICSYMSTQFIFPTCKYEHNNKCSHTPHKLHQSRAFFFFVVYKETDTPVVLHTLNHIDTGRLMLECLFQNCLQNNRSQYMVPQKMHTTILNTYEFGSKKTNFNIATKSL